ADYPRGRRSQAAGGEECDGRERVSDDGGVAGGAGGGVEKTLWCRRDGGRGRDRDSGRSRRARGRGTRATRLPDSKELSGLKFGRYGTTQYVQPFARWVCLKSRKRGKC